MTKVIEILRELGPSRSVDVVAALMKAERISNVTARQRVSRAGRPVRRVARLSLPNNEQFLYLEEQFNSPEFFDNLATVLIETRSSAGRALLGIEACGGAVPEVLFATIAGLPVHKTKGQIVYSSVKDMLLVNRLITIAEDPHYGEVICSRKSFELNRHNKARLQVEAIVLSVVRSWLTKLGIASFKSVAIRDEARPSFGPFQWDLVGPSYLNGLVEFDKGRAINGFVVADILLNTDVTLQNIEPFLYKCKFVVSQKRHRPFIAIFIADNFAHDALQELRKRGVIIGRPDALFGKEAAESLRSLIRTIENAAAVITRNPDSAFDLFAKIAKMEGASLNLRSVVFELIMARLYAIEGYKIDIRQVVWADEGKAEIDIKAVRDDRVVCVECKAMAPGNRVKKADIKEWLDNSLPVINSWLKKSETLPDAKSFEFCTSGSFTPEAERFIKEIQGGHKKRPIIFSNGAAIIDRLRKFRQNSLIRAFREHFG